MVGSESSQLPPGTSHWLRKLRSVAARWTMRRRGGGGAEAAAGDDEGLELEEEGAKMKLLTMRLVYCVFWERKVERGIARWLRKGGMWIWMGDWEVIAAAAVKVR